MAHLFFSYAHKDADRMYPIHKQMEAKLGRLLWIDRVGLRQGIEWENAIKRAIEQGYGVIFAVTQEFVGADRVFIHEKEIPWAIEQFKDKQGLLLFVLRFDDAEIPPELKKLPDYQCQVIDARDGDVERICGELKLPQEQEGDQPFYVSWPRLSTFKGRETLLIDLHDQLKGGVVGINAHGKSAGLYGTGGIGKTQLAVEYSYRYRYYYPAGVYWINAAGVNWMAELVRLADHLRLRPAAETDKNRDEQMIIALQHHIRERSAQEEGEALLILDNLENPNDVLRLPLPTGATLIGTAASFCEQAHARLLITTRRKDIPKEFAALSVDILSPEDARTLLKEAMDERANHPIPPISPHWIRLRQNSVGCRWRSVGWRQRCGS